MPTDNTAFDITIHACVAVPSRNSFLLCIMKTAMHSKNKFKHEDDEGKRWGWGDRARTTTMIPVLCFDQPGDSTNMLADNTTSCTTDHACVAIPSMNLLLLCIRGQRINSNSKCKQNGNK